MKFKIILILVLFLSTYSIVSIINNYNKINYKAISQTNKPINNNLSNKKIKNLNYNGIFQMGGMRLKVMIFL